MTNMFNKWADFWRLEVGANVIPSDTMKKTTYEKWAQYQNSPISKEQHEHWKNTKAFDRGMAVMLGELYYGPNKGKFLVGIDIDNAKGIEEFLSYFPDSNTLEKLSQKTIVEQHSDAKGEKAHFYFVVGNPLDQKSGIAVNKKKDSSIPAIEIKSQAKHGIMFCSPSYHKNGYPYQIVGTKEIQVLDVKETEKLEIAIIQIYQKYGIKSNNSIPCLPSIKEMDRDDYEVHEGNNRHLNVLRRVDSWYGDSNRKLTYDELFARAQQWNNIHCNKPLEDGDISKLVKQSMNSIDYNDTNNNNVIELAEPKNQSELLDKIPGRKILDHVINTAKKTIRQEDSLIRLILSTQD